MEIIDLFRRIHFGPQSRSMTINLVLVDNTFYPLTIIPFSALTFEHLTIQINFEHTFTFPFRSSNFSVHWRIYTEILNDAPPPFGY